MKLDKKVIHKILNQAYPPDLVYIDDYDELKEVLENMDLVVKPGDSSQSVLTLNDNG